MEQEQPQLSIPNYKFPLSHWLDARVEPWRKPTVLYIAKEYIKPAQWTHLVYDVTPFNLDEINTLRYMNTDMFDVVCVDSVLGCIEQRSELIAEASRICRRKVVAWNPACNDGEELVKQLRLDGIDVDPYIKRRLTNMDIVRLKPHEAVFLRDFKVFPEGRGLKEHIQSEGIDIFADQVDAHCHKDLAINILNVGMVWKKNE